ncbi:MAG TPA: site-specific integrase [Smithella sp.]|nr:site-specific integrase [Smithella sp.]
MNLATEIPATARYSKRVSKAIAERLIKRANSNESFEPAEINNQRNQLAVLINLFEDYLENVVGFRESAALNYIKVLKKLREWQNLEYVAFEKFDNKFAAMFSKFCFSQNLNATYVKTFLIYIKTVLRYYNISFDWKIQMSSKRRFSIQDQILTEDEIKRLLEFETQGIYGLDVAKDQLILSLYTGARFSEVQSAFMTINSEGEEIVSFFMEKNKSPRSLPMHPRLRTIFKNEYYKHVPNRAFQKRILKQIVKGQAIKTTNSRESKITIIPKYQATSFHSCRKTFICRLLEAGMDIYSVSRIAGHSTVEVTERYYAKISQSRINNEFKKTAATAFPE